MSDLPKAEEFETVDDARAWLDEITSNLPDHPEVLDASAIPVLLSVAKRLAATATTLCDMFATQKRRGDGYERLVDAMMNPNTEPEHLQELYAELSKGD